MVSPLGILKLYRVAFSIEKAVDSLMVAPEIFELTLNLYPAPAGVLEGMLTESPVAVVEVIVPNVVGAAKDPDAFES